VPRVVSPGVCIDLDAEPGEVEPLWRLIPSASFRGIRVERFRMFSILRWTHRRKNPSLILAPAPSRVMTFNRPTDLPSRPAAAVQLRACPLIIAPSSSNFVKAYRAPAAPSPSPRLPSCFATLFELHPTPSRWRSYFGPPGGGPPPGAPPPPELMARCIGALVLSCWFFCGFLLRYVPTPMLHSCRCSSP